MQTNSGTLSLPPTDVTSPSSQIDPLSIPFPGNSWYANDFRSFIRTYSLYSGILCLLPLLLASDVAFSVLSGVLPKGQAMIDKDAGTVFVRLTCNIGLRGVGGGGKKTTPVYFRLFVPSLAFAFAGTDDGVGSGFCFCFFVIRTKTICETNMVFLLLESKILVDLCLVFIRPVSCRTCPWLWVGSFLSIPCILLLTKRVIPLVLVRM